MRPGATIAVGGFEHAREIHAPVLEEMLVLGGGDGVLQDVRDLFEGEQDAALQREGADFLAVVGVELGDDVGAKRFQGVDFGKVAGIDEQQAGADAAGDGQNQQSGKGQTSGELAPVHTQSQRRQRVHGLGVYRRGGAAAEESADGDARHGEQEQAVDGQFLGRAWCFGCRSSRS